MFRGQEEAGAPGPEGWCQGGANEVREGQGGQILRHVVGNGKKIYLK